MEQIAPLEFGLVVRDLEKMQDFYCQILSCKELRRADIPRELSRAIRTSENGYVNVWLQTPYREVIKLAFFEDPEGNVIELVERTEGE